MNDTQKKFGTTGLAFEEPSVFEQSVSGRTGFSFSKPSVPNCDLEKKFDKLLKDTPLLLPELSEGDVVRHFTRLSINNYSKDLGFYPLGSCTMKHNPKIANVTSSIQGFANSHPYTPEEYVQGNLRLCFELESYLAEITGMHSVSLMPAAGSHGELTGMLIVRAYHASKGKARSKVLIPDSAH